MTLMTKNLLVGSFNNHIGTRFNYFEKREIQHELEFLVELERNKLGEETTAKCDKIFTILNT